MRGRRANPLEQYFRNNDQRLIHKWAHYFDIYDHHFERFRGQRVRVVEFGVSHGGSLQMWKYYFGRRAEILGVDIDPRCKDLGERGIQIHIADQDDRQSLRALRAEILSADIVIDDGGHRMTQQIQTFEEFYPVVDNNGVYLVEDTHTSYWARKGGGYRKPDTFIEYAKGLVDHLHAWHSEDEAQLSVDDFCRTTKSVTFYDSVVIFEKGKIERPRSDQTGKRSF
jgi:hypothetical protein